MQFVTKEQIDQFYIKFKGKDIVNLNEMLEVFQEIFDHPAPVKMMSEDNKKKITHSLFTNPTVMNDLKEAAEDNELIYNEEDIMRIVHVVQNGRWKI